MPEQNKKKNIFNPNRIQDVQRENPFAKISDIVYDILAEAILSTSILPGSKLNIASIAEQLQVSRTPVFTAIERLKESGLVIESYETGKYRSYLCIQCCAGGHREAEEAGQGLPDGMERLRY